MIDFKNIEVSLDIKKPIEAPKYPLFHIADASTHTIYENQMQQYLTQTLALSGRKQEKSYGIKLSYKF